MRNELWTLILPLAKKLRLKYCVKYNSKNSHQKSILLQMHGLNNDNRTYSYHILSYWQRFLLIFSHELGEVTKQALEFIFAPHDFRSPKVHTSGTQSASKEMRQCDVGWKILMLTTGTTTKGWATAEQQQEGTNARIRERNGSHYQYGLRRIFWDYFESSVMPQLPDSRNVPHYKFQLTS